MSTTNKKDLAERVLEVILPTDRIILKPPKAKSGSWFAELVIDNELDTVSAVGPTPNAALIELEQRIVKYSDVINGLGAPTEAVQLGLDLPDALLAAIQATIAHFGRVDIDILGVKHREIDVEFDCPPDGVDFAAKIPQEKLHRVTRILFLLEDHDGNMVKIITEPGHIDKIAGETVYLNGYSSIEVISR